MTFDAHMERLLGWHVLIPTRTGRPVYLQGLPQNAGVTWAQMRNETVVDDAKDADLGVYWNRAPHISTGRHGWACVGAGCAKVPHAKAYALIPPSDPRLVLPLNDKAQLLRGLAMHRPGRKTARAAVWLLVLAVRLGIRWPLMRRVLWIDVGNDQGAPVAAAGSVLYLGTADGNRKTTILPPDGQSITKHGQGAVPVAALRREADALAALARTPIAARIPTVFSFVQDDCTASLSQEYRARVACGKRHQRRDVAAFLDDLSKIGAETRNGIPGHRCHGDFAPWNMMNTAKGFFVFDWEDSLAWAPALTDAFYFATADYFNINGKADLARVTTRALDFAASIAQRQGIDAKHLHPLWLRWLENRTGNDPHHRAKALLQAQKDISL